jgi:hypothetical protein
VNPILPKKCTKRPPEHTAARREAQLDAHRLLTVIGRALTRDRTD